MAQATDVGRRIQSIDALRGFAVLGILLINISVFALPPTYLSIPDSLPNHSGPNLVLWTFNEAAILGAMRTLFSMLFGAGVVLFTIGREGRADAGEVADAYFRRTILLIVFGFVHAFVLLSHVDVLFPYGIVGLFLYSFRRLPPRWLMLLGVVALSVPTPFVLRSAVRLHGDRAAAEAVRSLEAGGQEPDEELRRRAERWATAVEGQERSPSHIDFEIEARRSGYWANFRHSAWISVPRQSSYLYKTLFWDVGGMMLLGMALHKLGVLTAARDRRFYLMMVGGGFGVGLPIRGAAIWLMTSNGFDPWSLEASRLTYDLSRLSLALGYIGVVMLVCRSGAWRGLVETLAASGRMALTNYLSQTIACTLLFYGFGLGLYGKLEPWMLLLPVVAIWTFQLLGSRWWLMRYRYGPAEWLWRCLTYGRLEPLRRGGQPAKGADPTHADAMGP